MDKRQSPPEPPQAWLWPQPHSSSPKALTSTSPAAAKTNSTTQSAKSAAVSPVYAATRVIRAISTSSSTRYVLDTARRCPLRQRRDRHRRRAPHRGHRGLL